MPSIDIPGGRVVYDRGLSGICIDDGGKQHAISPIAVRVFSVQAAEIERLMADKANTASAIRNCADAAGLNADQSWDDSAAYWGGRMSAEITSLKKQIAANKAEIERLREILDKHFICPDCGRSMRLNSYGTVCDVGNCKYRALSGGEA